MISTSAADANSPVHQVDASDLPPFQSHPPRLAVTITFYFTGDEFKDHIKEHRSLVDTFQCVECGMCFPVQLALRRHLFAVHKVSDYVKYSRHQYMAEYEKQLHGAQGKCPVCEKQFEEEMLLRKHLRTHGMMYINTRRMVTS